MGYNVCITKSSLVIPAAAKPEILQIWKDLNKPENNDLKRGGSWSGGKEVAKWFSWMPEDYDKTCNTVEEILGHLGFDHETLCTGAIVDFRYDRKTGQEDLFFSKIQHLIEGEVEWVGEDHETFYWTFTGESTKRLN